MESKIREIIKDIEECSKESPNELYERLVKERLDVILIAYVEELNWNYDNIENSITDKNVSKILRRAMR